MRAPLNLTTYDQGPYAPVSDELSTGPLPVVGQLPAELNGLFAQNSPNPRFAPIGHSHWFDGDGMVHGLRIQDGAVRYTNRWVNTLALQADLAAGQATKPGILMPFDPADPAPDRDTANTDLVWQGGKLMATWYLGGKPYALDPETLDTLGPVDFNGALDCGVAAHAKRCPATGELLFIDFSLYRPPWLRYGVVSADGRLTHRLDIDIPQPTFMHDLAFTTHHTVFLDLPMTWERSALAKGRRRIAFDKASPARFGVLPRHGTEVQWFEDEACYCYHSVNAWEEQDAAGNTVVVLTACRIEDPLPKGPHDQEPDIPRLTFLRLQPVLWRWTFNLGTGAVTSNALDDRPGEFPRINDRWLGRRSRYSYIPHIAKAPTLAFDGLMRHDDRDGKVDLHDFGGRVSSEAVFAPRPDGTHENDGWLLALTHSRDGRDSELRVWHAQDFTGAPVARVPLPRRVPFGFHAAWMPLGA